MGSLTIDHVLSAVRDTVFLVVIPALVYLWGMQRKANQSLSDEKDTVVKNRLDEFQRRLDRAGQRASDLSDRIQVLPQKDELERMWAEFVRFRTAIENRLLELERRL